MTSRDVYFFGNACAFESSRKAVSVPTSVIGGLGAPWRPAILLTCGSGIISIIDSFHISGRPWQPRTLSAIGWPPRTANFVLALSTDERHFRSLQSGLSFLSISLLTFFYEMQSPASYGCAWSISDRPRAEQSRCGVSSSGVSAQGRGPSMFAWKATTKTSLAQKARAPKRSLARKEILISAVRLTVDLSPFLQLTLSYKIGSRWQRQLCLTALHICR